MRNVIPQMLVVLCVSAVMHGPTPGAAQGRPDLADAPDAVFPEPFSRIVGLRELSDGRVLVADQIERRVSFIDFATSAVEQVGRRGEGPGEYESPQNLFATESGASLLVDFGTMRMTRIEPNGTLTTSWPLLSAGQTVQILQPSGADLQGRVYHSSAGRFNVQAGAGGPEPSDSAPVNRWDLEANTTDTVATLFAPANITMTRGGGGMRFNVGGGATISGLRRSPFPTRDTWAVAPDGRVAVVRATEYRVDWYAPNGVVTRGPAVNHDPIRITDGEKEAWADRQASRSMTMRVMGGTGGGSRSFQAPRPDLDEVDFPEFKPPFEADAAAVTPDGTVWVKRSGRHDDTDTLYDVFDAQGERIRQVQFPNGRSVVGFGAGVVYVVVQDEDDLQWLERYRR